MSTHRVTTAENSKNQRDFTKNSSNLKESWDGRVARGEGFEPAKLDEEVEWT